MSRGSTPAVRDGSSGVSTGVTGTADRERRSSGRPFGLVFDDADKHIRIWVKTWGEIIQAAEHRLKYVKAQLGVSADQRTALEYLKQLHAEKLPTSLAEERAA
jgi:hypothetical protein